MGPAARFGVEGAEAFDTAGCPVRLGGAALNFGSTDVCCVGTILLAEADGRGGGVRERPESSSGTDVRGPTGEAALEPFAHSTGEAAFEPVAMDEAFAADTST